MHHFQIPKPLSNHNNIFCLGLRTINPSYLHNKVINSAKIHYPATIYPVNNRSDVEFYIIPRSKRREDCAGPDKTRSHM